MNILVIGGAGYVGSHTVRLLKRAGHEVWVYDNLCRGHRAAVPDGCLIEGALEDSERLIAALKSHRIEAVMHFAAFIEVGESVVDPAKYYHNNVVGTLAMLDALRTANVNKIVFSSTTATYGVPDRIPITESEKQLPINPYGFTKLVIERVLEDYSHAYGLGYAALRYFNAAGASPDGDIGEDHTPETHLIPIVLQVAAGTASGNLAVRRRLHHSRWVVHSRLYPRRRPRGRPHQSPGSPGAGKKLEAKSWDGARAQCPRSGRCLPTTDRPPDPVESRTARGGFAATGRRFVACTTHARLAAKTCGNPRHCRDGLALAQFAPPRLRRWRLALVARRKNVLTAAGR